MDRDYEKIPLKTRIFNAIKKWIMVVLNPRLLLCLFVAWMITNGWSYVFVALGTLLDITWMVVTGTAYMSLLWVPFTPEKILTVVIAIFLMRAIFPKDQKTVAVLKEELKKLKRAYIAQRDKRREKRNHKKSQNEC
ncbi:MAG: hypothetical protein IJ433_07125 [Ruminococcus sp.]|nr:hypothetical protein [Ruminococcus sp.]